MMRLCACAMLVKALCAWSSMFIMSVRRACGQSWRGQFGVGFSTGSLLRKTSNLRTCCASPAAPLGDFRTDSLFEKTSNLRTCCASPAAPLGDFRTDSLFEKTSNLRTCCASPAAPLGDFCTDSLFEKTSNLRTCCDSPAAPLGDFRMDCRTRGVAIAVPRGDFCVGRMSKTV
jgi:hypothetical protein